MAETRELILLIDSEIDDELTAIAQSTGRDKRSIAREALIGWLEDQEDIRAAREVIAQDNKPMTIEEVEKFLDLAG